MQTGAPIVVQSNKTATGIDFALAPAATVSGRIFDGSTGGGIAGVAITLWRHTAAGPSFSSGTISNSAGNFAVTGLTAATYFAYTLNSAGYVDSTYGGTPCVVSCQQIRETAPGSPIVVTAGTIVSARDFVLIRGGVIAGRITDATTGRRSRTSVWGPCIAAARRRSTRRGPCSRAAAVGSATPPAPM